MPWSSSHLLLIRCVKGMDTGEQGVKELLTMVQPLVVSPPLANPNLAMGTGGLAPLHHYRACSATPPTPMG